MPLLDATGASAEVICLGCGVERTVGPGEWVFSEDDAVFGTPPCSCGAQESFQWNDWVYRRTLENRHTRKRTQVADPDHEGAKQQVLVAEVGAALRRAQRKVPDRVGLKYQRPVTRPTKDEVRAYTSHVRAMKRLQRQDTAEPS